MDSYFNTRLSRKRKKQKKINQLLFIFFLLIIVSFLFSRLFNIKNQPPSTIVTPSATPYISPTSNDAKHNVDLLKSVTQNALAGTTGMYGIAVKNLKSGESFYMNEHKVFEPGSLYKLWVMAVVYKQIQAGTLQEDQVLSTDVSVLNEKFKISSESANQTEGTITLSVTDALNKMITISDNYSALLLTEKVRLSNIASFLKKNGFTESTVGTNGGNPTATPFDIALFLEKLYKGELANEKYTKEMIDLLMNQRLNNKLPKYLPQNVVIAHKTGEIDSFTHDAGIVYTSKGDYIIVVLSNSDYPPDAEERISEVSKNIYNYFIE